jgi:molybdate transport system ATP-binding protein
MTEAAAVRAEVRLPRAGFTLDVRFAAPARGITGILGHSGSGKTTLLRCIAGLEPECRGEVAVNGAVWQDASRFAPPHARAAGFVFQDARLFPHLTVRHNLEYGLRRASGNGGVSFDEAVELLGLAPLLARKPAGLSAGEAQRVALARALLRAPSVMLMDEPLANLDPERRQEVLPFLERLHGRLTIPILYVSHSVDEVVRLCDHLVLMAGGRIGGAGSLREVLGQADLVGRLGEEFGTILDGTVHAIDVHYELTGIDTPAGRFLVPGRHGAAGDALRLRILARDVSVALEAPARSTILNVLPAEVASLQQRGGGYVDLELRVGEAMLLSRISRRSAESLDLRPGARCYAQVKGVAVRGAVNPVSSRA